MKQITTKSGIKGYQCHLQDNYSSFDEFDGYGATYGLATRLGFKNALEAWEANPVIQGSTNPEDFCTVTLVNEGQPVQVEGFMLLLNEGNEDETAISLVDYINAFDEDLEADFMPVINLTINQSCQYGADTIKRISCPSPTLLKENEQLKTEIKKLQGYQAYVALNIYIGSDSILTFDQWHEMGEPKE